MNRKERKTLKMKMRQERRVERQEFPETRIRFVSERSKKTGLEPGTPVLVGRNAQGAASIHVCEYDGDRLEERVTEDVTRCLSPDGEGVRWIDVNGLGDIALLQTLGNRYGIHGLVLEDIVNTEQRAKVESYGELLFVVVRMARIPDGALDPILDQISLVLVGNTVLSFQPQGEDAFHGVRGRLRIETSRLRNAGADFLLYALMDEMADNAFDVLEAIGLQIEQVEESVMMDNGRKPLRHINKLRRELMYLHRSAWPMREAAGSLSRGEHPQMKPETLLFLRDVYDHTIVAMDTIETYRDLLNGLLDIYLSASGNRMNGIMKVLTVISTIFMPLTFLAGIYGMNFKYMPELEWRWGYPALLGLMVLIVSVMFWVLKRKKWL